MRQGSHACIDFFTFHILFVSYIFVEGSMEKEKIEMKLQEKKSREKFNSITQKVKPENQNQHHNVKKEGVDAKRRQV